MPKWAKKQGFANNAQAVAGREALRAAGCLNCHTYHGAGASNLGAPDLTAIGAKGQGVEFRSRPTSSDPRKFGNTIMPLFGKQLGEEQPAAARGLPRRVQGREVAAPHLL